MQTLVVVLSFVDFFIISNAERDHHNLLIVSLKSNLHGAVRHDHPSMVLLLLLLRFLVNI